MDMIRDGLGGLSTANIILTGKTGPTLCCCRPMLTGFHPEILYFRMLKLSVFFPETRSFFFWQGNQTIMRKRILMR